MIIQLSHPCMYTLYSTSLPSPLHVHLVQYLSPLTLACTPGTSLLSPLHVHLVPLSSHPCMYTWYISPLTLACTPGTSLLSPLHVHLVPLSSHPCMYTWYLSHTLFTCSYYRTEEGPWHSKSLSFQRATFETDRGQEAKGEIYTHIQIYFLYTVHPEILAVIKFGNLPKIWPKCIIGGV